MNKRTIASIVMGITGGVLALYLYATTERSHFYFTAVGPFTGFQTLVAGTVGLLTGFASCFLVTMWYIKHIESKQGNQKGIRLSALAGGFAGLIVGAIYGVLMEVFEPAPNVINGFGVAGIFAVPGMLYGIPFGLCARLIFGSVFFKEWN